jgi:hypothetical protein
MLIFHRTFNCGHEVERLCSESEPISVRVSTEEVLDHDFEHVGFFNYYFVTFNIFGAGGFEKSTYYVNHWSSD